MYFPIQSSRVGDGLHDVALISLSFTPENTYELADYSEDEYWTDEIRSPGESGMPMLDEDGKLCAVLSRSRDSQSVYCGIHIRDYLVFEF